MKAQLLFYPVTEQLFVFNDSQVRCVPAVKKIKKAIDIHCNQYYINIITYGFTLSQGFVCNQSATEVAPLSTLSRSY